MNSHFESGNKLSIVILYLSSYDEISQLFKYRRLSSSLIGQMKDALKKNVWMGVLAAVAGTTYVVYMVVTKKGSLSQVIGAAYLISYMLSAVIEVPCSVIVQSLLSCQVMSRYDTSFICIILCNAMSCHAADIMILLTYHVILCPIVL
jgi:hypothetical protein